VITRPEPSTATAPRVRRPYQDLYWLQFKQLDTPKDGRLRVTPAPNRPMGPQFRCGRVGSANRTAASGALRRARPALHSPTSKTITNTLGAPSTRASPIPNHPPLLPRASSRTLPIPRATLSTTMGGIQGHVPGSSTASSRRPSLKATYQNRQHHHTMGYDDPAPAPNANRTSPGRSRPPTVMALSPTLTKSQNTRKMTPTAIR
jgi:hypothetical protein